MKDKINYDWNKELEELYNYVFEQKPSEVEMNLRAEEYENGQS